MTHRAIGVVVVVVLALISSSKTSALESCPSGWNEHWSLTGFTAATNIKLDPVVQSDAPGQILTSDIGGRIYWGDLVSDTITFTWDDLPSHDQGKNIGFVECEVIWVLGNGTNM